MRILLISHAFPPHPASGSARTYSFARTWADAGHHVTVLTTAKRPEHRTRPRDCAGFDVIEIDFKPPRLFEALRRLARGGRTINDDKSSNDDATTNVNAKTNNDATPNADATTKAGATKHADAESNAAHRRANQSPSTAPPSPSRNAPPRRNLRSRLRELRDRTGVFGGARMPDLTDFWVRPAVRWARTQPKWDLIVSSTGPYTALLVGRRLKRENRCRLFAVDIRDLWARNAVQPGLPPFAWLERRLERKVLAHADLVTTVSHGLADELAPRTNAPVHVIYNGFETDMRDAASGWHGQADSFALAHDDVPSRSASNQTSVFPADHLIRLVFTGTIYPAIHDPAPLLRAVAKLRAENPAVGERLRITVAGPACDHWSRAAACCGAADAVEARGQIPHADALAMQRDAHAILILDAAPPHRGILTSKLFEYLLAPAPILALAGPPDSELAAIINRARRGVHLGTDESRIADTLTTLVEDPTALRTSPNEEYIATFNRTVQAKRFLEIAEPMMERDAAHD